MGGSAASAPLTDRWLLLSILTASYGAGSFGMLGLSPLSPSLLDRRRAARGPTGLRLLLEGSDSYAAAWTAFAALSALVTITMLTAGPTINRTGGSDLPRT